MAYEYGNFGDTSDFGAAHAIKEKLEEMLGAHEHWTKVRTVDHEHSGDSDYHVEIWKNEHPDNQEIWEQDFHIGIAWEPGGHEAKIVCFEEWDDENQYVVRACGTPTEAPDPNDFSIPDSRPLLDSTGYVRQVELSGDSNDVSRRFFFWVTGHYIHCVTEVGTNWYMVYAGLFETLTDEEYFPLVNIDWMSTSTSNFSGYGGAFSRHPNQTEEDSSNWLLDRMYFDRTFWTEPSGEIGGDPDPLHGRPVGSRIVLLHEDGDDTSPGSGYVRGLVYDMLRFHTVSSVMPGDEIQVGNATYVFASCPTSDLSVRAWIDKDAD